MIPDSSAPDAGRSFTIRSPTMTMLQVSTAPYESALAAMIR